MRYLACSIRFIATMGLIYGAYTETGIITAFNFLLIFFAIEALVYLYKK